MSSQIRMFIDGGNRLTKVMQEMKKPFSFPTVISPAEIDLNYGLNFDLENEEADRNGVELESLLVEIIKDGESLGKKLVGKAAEKKGLLVRDRNRYEKKAGDEVIAFCTLAGIGYNLCKQGRDQDVVDLTMNQPLIEYATDRKGSIVKFEKHLKGDIRVLFYNIYNTAEVVATIRFTIQHITFCPEAIATFFRHAVDESGQVRNEYKGGKKTIIWDIGSGQVNIAAFEGMTVMGINTFEKGMMDCYEKISLILYNNYREQLGRKLANYETDNVIRYGGCLVKAKKGQDIDIRPIVRNVFDNFAYEMHKDIRDFARSKDMSNSDSVIFCGGGSEILYGDLCKYLGKDFSCSKGNMGEFDNVVGGMYYRMYRDRVEA